MGSFDDSIVVGRVLYAINFSIVPQDECWIPAKTDPIKLSIIPIGGIHIFIGETIDSDGNTLVSHTDATAAEQDAVAKIRSESHEPPKEDSALGLEISKPTKSAPEQVLWVYFMGISTAWTRSSKPGWPIDGDVTCGPSGGPVAVDHEDEVRPRIS
jgi:hypothetical protein